MTLSWNEIKDRALRFSKEWADTEREEADAKPFLVEFFNVFGLNRKKIATFEEKVKKLDDGDGYIDLFWKGTLLVEMKSRGKNLDRAYEQAKDYLQRVPQHELPKYILVSDFEHFRLTDLEDETTVAFTLKDFSKNVQHFGYLLGYQKKTYKEQDPANIKAAELMGKLHDRLEEIGYEGHALEVYLVRILFCLFAEDTTIFNKQQFQDYIEQRTSQDGSDLAARVQELFQVLNTPREKRFKNLDEQLADFPYVNGRLFEEILPNASFDAAMRQALLNCCYLDWSKISPAIFGSMFQSVMNPKERRNLGAHYTSEKNILKLIKPLFLDELWKEFEAIKDNKNKLSEFHKKLSTLRFLDPACGCGNFLVITYRELRLLELEILRHQYKTQMATSIESIIWLDVDQFYGIEYEEFPAQIAQVAMWLIDHQMNLQISNEFGQYFVRLPLKKAANIVHGNALRIDWETLLTQQPIEFVSEEAQITLREPEPEYQISIRAKSLTIIDQRSGKAEAVHIRKSFDYIIGNPPFIGSKFLNDSQREDIRAIFKDNKNAGVLDYVSGWYALAAQYISRTEQKTECAFVSTNSITQGEQVSALWNELLYKYKVVINFAHQTFKWSNEARGNAAVYCVIVGFAKEARAVKTLFQYDTVSSEPHAVIAKNINPYLIDAKNLVVEGRTSPLTSVGKLVNGSVPADGGHLILTKEEKDEIIDNAADAERWIRIYLGGDGFINNTYRYCLWLKHCSPNELRDLPGVLRRVQAVREVRLKSPKIATQKKADIATLFTEDRQPEEGYYIAIPRTSSERRKYIPMGYLSSEIIASNDLQIVPNGSLYEFGVLTSMMHMSWMKLTAGRLESRYRYSALFTYNTFPWPETPTDKQVKAIEAAAQKVLDARAQFPGISLADLYDPLTMPPALVKAHQELDKAVDLAYRPQPFTSDAKRMEFLFELYEKYTAGLFTTEKKKKRS